jgi:hypothetical protein
MNATAASREITIRLTYQSAGILRVVFQMGLIVSKIPNGPLNITTARIRATSRASDSMPQ